MSTAHIAFRHLAFTLGVLLVSCAAFLAITHAPHAQPVSLAEIDGALTQVSQLVASPADGAR